LPPYRREGEVDEESEAGVRDEEEHERRLIVAGLAGPLLSSDGLSAPHTLLLLVDAPLGVPAALRPPIQVATSLIGSTFLGRYRRQARSHVPGASLRLHLGLHCLRALVERHGPDGHPGQPGHRSTRDRVRSADCARQIRLDLLTAAGQLPIAKVPLNQPRYA
jgi:hypothetical protein